MKKMILIATIISMLLMISACSNGGNSADNGAVDNTPSATDGKTTTSTGSTGTSGSGSTGTAGSSGEFDTSQASTTPEGCYDSDGGSFDKIKGYVLDLNKENYVDECVNTFSVREYYCGITGYKSDKIINCKFECEDGKCIEGTAATTACVDSDFSDEFTKGTVTYKGETKTDYCSSAKMLVEQICSNVDIATTKEVVCDGSCTDGKCIKVVAVDQSSDCTDPDQGPGAEFTKTTVTDKKGSYTDSCLNMYEVKEYYCNSYGYHADKNIRCATGCQDGICV